MLYISGMSLENEGNIVDATLRLSSKIDLIRWYVYVVARAYKLTESELEVLAQLMYVNNLKYSIPEKDRYISIFSKDSRDSLSSKMNISKNVLENRFTSLRKKGIIVNNVLIPQFNRKINKSYVIAFLNEKK